MEREYVKLRAAIESGQICLSTDGIVAEVEHSKAGQR